MSTTWTPIASTQLGSATNTVTFSSIPNIYRDLIFVMTANTSSMGRCDITVNDSTGFSLCKIFYGSSISANSFGTSGNLLLGQNSSFGITQGSYIIHLLDYLRTSFGKSVISHMNTNDSGSGSEVNTQIGRLDFGTITATTSVTFNTNGGSFSSGAVFSLYGVVA